MSLSIPAVSFGSLEELDSLDEGEQIGSFRATARYEAAGERPAGARFVHIPTGMSVDLLRSDSAAQATVWIRTLPVSDRGEPYALQHLLMETGRKALLFSAACDSAMASRSAATRQSRTTYDVRTVADQPSFLEVIHLLLDALVNPDLTDEEIRRTLWHLAVREDENTSKLYLEEQGSVYRETLRDCAEPRTIAWNRTLELCYGREHPLGFNCQGEPDGVRIMELEHIRNYHRDHYFPDRRIGLILALPPPFALEPFLEDLDEILREVRGTRRAMDENSATAFRRRSPVDMPHFLPRSVPVIHLRPFPSESPSTPGLAVLAWPSRKDLSPLDLLALQTLWHILAGDETSYLHGDLVNQASRQGPGGIGHVLGDIPSLEGYPPMIWLEEMDPALLRPDSLLWIRKITVERLSWIAELQPGSPEFAEVCEKARTYLEAARSELTEWTATPPCRESTDARPYPGLADAGDFRYWRLQQLARQAGFRKDVTRGDQYRTFEEAIAEDNPWAELVRKLELLREPFVAVAYPDTTLAGKTDAARDKRIAQTEEALQDHYGTADSQEALSRFRDFLDAKSE
jgi:Zn-dependent M16 (insulinase) family peptidase